MLASNAAHNFLKLQHKSGILLCLGPAYTKESVNGLAFILYLVNSLGKHSLELLAQPDFLNYKQ